MTRVPSRALQPMGGLRKQSGTYNESRLPCNPSSCRTPRLVQLIANLPREKCEKIQDYDGFQGTAANWKNAPARRLKGGTSIESFADLAEWAYAYMISADGAVARSRSARLPATSPAASSQPPVLQLPLAKTHSVRVVRHAELSDVRHQV